MVDAQVIVPYYGGTGVLTIGSNGTLKRSNNSNLNVNPKGYGRGEVNLIGGTLDNGGATLNFGTGSSPGAGGAGIVNLNAGTLATARFNATSFGDSRVNLNGGILKASSSGNDFMPETITSVYVNGSFDSFEGGAVVDTAGNDITIAASLLAPTGQGVSALAVADGGSGYIGAPYVSIVDDMGSGFGATAIAEMVDDGTGNGTLKVGSIKVTNPGVNYTAGFTRYTVAKGAPVVEATSGAVTLTANTSGGLKKIGGAD